MPAGYIVVVQKQLTFVIALRPISVPKQEVVFEQVLTQFT
jgi:hypothetical protein